MSLTENFLACSCGLIRQEAYREAARSMKDEIIASGKFGAAVGAVFHATHTETKPGCRTCLPHIGKAIVDALGDERPQLRASYDAWKSKKFSDDKPATDSPQKPGCTGCGGCKGSGCAVAFDFSPLR